MSEAMVSAAEPEDLCIVCLDQPRSLRFFECGHAHTCALCALTLIGRLPTGSSLTCPTCKAAVTRIEEYDPAQAVQPAFIQGGDGGVPVAEFIDAQLSTGGAAHRTAASSAQQAWHRPAAPVELAMEREHVVRTRDLRGCWLNVCAVPMIVPCSVYTVRPDGDMLHFRAVGCCLCCCCLLVPGKYRRDNYHSELRYEKVAGGMGAQHFVVHSGRRMTSELGGHVYKLCG